MQLQVTVLAFSCLTITQCSMISAVDGGCWLRMRGGGVPTREIRRDVEASSDRAKQEFARERASQADRTWENEVGERPDSELDEVVDESRESENGETIAFGSLVSAGISPASRFGRGVSCMGRAPQQAPASIIISSGSPTHEFFPKLVLERVSSLTPCPVTPIIALHKAR